MEAAVWPPGRFRCSPVTTSVRELCAYRETTRECRPIRGAAQGGGRWPPGDDDEEDGLLNDHDEVMGLGCRAADVVCGGQHGNSEVDW